MENLKDLQKMAKKGEVSAELLGDNDFKIEFKKIIKEETDVEIKDEQIPEIIKNFENALQDDNILKEAELASVSGGADMSSSKMKFYKEKYEYLGDRIGGIGMALGIIGITATGLVTGGVLKDAGKEAFKKGNTLAGAGCTGAMYGLVGIGAAGLYGAAKLNSKLGNLIAEKLYKRKMKELGVNNAEISSLKNKK